MFYLSDISFQGLDLDTMPPGVKDMIAARMGIQPVDASPPRMPTSSPPSSARAVEMIRRMNAEKTGEKTEEDKKSEPQNESVLTSEQSKVPTDETTKLTDSKPEDSQELFEASPVKSPTAEPVPKGRGRGRGVTPGGRGRGGLKRPAAALAPLKRPAASAPTLDAPEGTEETKGSDAEDKSDVKVPTVSGDGDGDGVGSSGDLPTTKNAKVSPKVNKHDAKEEKPKKTKKGGKRVLLQTVGQWEVYEMERLKGVHVGQKYKAFVDTSNGVTYYSKTQAIANGFQPS